MPNEYAHATPIRSVNHLSSLNTVIQKDSSRDTGNVDSGPVESEPDVMISGSIGMEEPDCPLRFSRFIKVELD